MDEVYDIQSGDAPADASTPVAPTPTPSATTLRDRIPGAPANTRYVADRRTKQYFPVTCAAAAAVPEEARFFYEIEGAAQADGYTPGTC